jgi:hypothetical protein
MALEAGAAACGNNRMLRKKSKADWLVNSNIQQQDDWQVLIHSLLAIYIMSNTAPSHATSQIRPLLAAIDLFFCRVSIF